MPIYTKLSAISVDAIQISQKRISQAAASRAGDAKDILVPQATCLF